MNPAPVPSEQSVPVIDAEEKAMANRYMRSIRKVYQGPLLRYAWTFDKDAAPKVRKTVGC